MQTQQWSNTYHMCLPYPPTGNIIQCSPWQTEPSPQQNWKEWTVNCNLTLTAGMGWNTESAQANCCGARSWTLSENSHGKKSNKGWEWGWGNKPTTRSRVVVDHCASLMGLRAVLKTSLPHLTGGGADQPELQLWGNTAAAWWNNIRSDHSARTGSELPQVPIAHCPVDRGTKYCSQASHLVRPLAMNTPKDQEKGGNSSSLHPKLSDKRGSTLPHKTQNIKHQYQDWMPKD
jgi:hypothetical protein